MGGGCGGAGLPLAAIEKASAILERCVREGSIHGGVLAVARDGCRPQPAHGGRLACLCHVRAMGASPPPNGNNPTDTGLRDSLPIVDDSIFLVASVTKPVTATAVLQLVQKGQLDLDQTVCSIIPQFSGAGREHVTIRHLLTHTSGLPDGIPENQEFRRRHAPLADFTTRMLSLDLLFPAGSAISYQSAGINILGHIVHQITGLSLPQYLKFHIFEPLGMHDTTLGIAADRDQHREIACHIDPAAGQTKEEATAVLLTSHTVEDAFCNWNSSYWREMGAPWGGLTTTVRDYSRFMQAFLHGGGPLLRPEWVEQMTRDQTSGLPGMSAKAAQNQAYGFGWRMNTGVEPSWGPGYPTVFGHGGATGASVFADPESGLSVCLFTTQPGFGKTGAVQAIAQLLLGGLEWIPGAMVKPTQTINPRL